MDSNYKPIEEKGLEALKRKVAALPPHVQQHGIESVVPLVDKAQVQVLLNAGVSPRKLTAMQDYAIKLKRQHPKMAQWELERKVCKQFNVEQKK